MTTEEYRQYVAGKKIERQRQERKQEAISLVHRLPVMISLVIAVIFAVGS